MTTAETVKNLIADQLGVNLSEVTPSAMLTDDLGADSLDIVELIMVFEEEFGLEISDVDAEQITIVQDAIVYIENHV